MLLPDVNTYDEHNFEPASPTQALRVVKHLCTKGASNFQRLMQRNSGVVRCAGGEATQALTLNVLLPTSCIHSMLQLGSLM